MEDEKAGKAGKVIRPGGLPPKFGGTIPQASGLSLVQQTIAHTILSKYDLRYINASQAHEIQNAFTEKGIGEAGLRWAVQDAGMNPSVFFSLLGATPAGGNMYVMTDAVPHGINVRQKATSESKLLYMLAKVDATHPVITITKISDDKLWGFMETGDKKKDGWIYLEYVRPL